MSSMRRPGRKPDCSGPIADANAAAKRVVTTLAIRRYTEGRSVMGRLPAGVVIPGKPGLGKGVMVPRLKPRGK